MRPLLVGMGFLVGLGVFLWFLSRGDGLALAGAFTILFLPVAWTPLAFPEILARVYETEYEELDGIFDEIRLYLLPWIEPLSLGSGIAAGLWIGWVALNWMWVGLLFSAAFLFVAWLSAGANLGSLRLSGAQVISIFVGQLLRQLYG